MSPSVLAVRSGLSFGLAASVLSQSAPSVVKRVATTIRAADIVRCVLRKDGVQG